MRKTATSRKRKSKRTRGASRRQAEVEDVEVSENNTSANIDEDDGENRGSKDVSFASNDDEMTDCEDNTVASNQLQTNVSEETNLTSEVLPKPMDECVWANDDFKVTMVNNEEDSSGAADEFQDKGNSISIESPESKNESKKRTSDATWEGVDKKRARIGSGDEDVSCGLEDKEFKSKSSLSPASRNSNEVDDSIHASGKNADLENCEMSEISVVEDVESKAEQTRKEDHTSLKDEIITPAAVDLIASETINGGSEVQIEQSLSIECSSNQEMVQTNRVGKDSSNNEQVENKLIQDCRIMNSEIVSSEQTTEIKSDIVDSNDSCNRILEKNDATLANHESNLENNVTMSDDSSNSIEATQSATVNHTVSEQKKEVDNIENLREEKDSLAYRTMNAVESVSAKESEKDRGECCTEEKIQAICLDKDKILEQRKKEILLQFEYDTFVAEEMNNDKITIEKLVHS